MRFPDPFIRSNASQLLSGHNTSLCSCVQLAMQCPLVNLHPLVSHSLSFCKPASLSTSWIPRLFNCSNTYSPILIAVSNVRFLHFSKQRCFILSSRDLHATAFLISLSHSSITEPQANNFRSVTISSNVSPYF